jgi:hypothetical protein
MLAVNRQTAVNIYLIQRDSCISTYCEEVLGYWSPDPEAEVFIGPCLSVPLSVYV